MYNEMVPEVGKYYIVSDFTRVVAGDKRECTNFLVHAGPFDTFGVAGTARLLQGASARVLRIHEDDVRDYAFFDVREPAAPSPVKAPAKPDITSIRQMVQQFLDGASTSTDLAWQMRRIEHDAAWVNALLNQLGHGSISSTKPILRAWLDEHL